MKLNRNMNHISQSVVALLIAGLFVVPVSANILPVSQKEKSQPAHAGGETIYVDGDNTAGPWDGTAQYPYRFIQDGVDHATDGDIVYVFNSLYVENVVVSKSLTLMGEGKESTILTGNDFGTVVNIFASNVTVTGFTIKDGGSNSNNAGVMLHSSFNIIKENNIEKNHYFGLYVLEVNNSIYHNNILGNTYQAFDVVAGSAWDSGYPGGGNYWSDYNGTDEDEDGIGEIQVPTGNSSADRYPLVHPYSSITNADTKKIFLAIQAAIDDANTSAGQMILVKNGLYREHVLIYKSVPNPSGGRPP